MAVWSRAWYIVWPLVVVILGHFSLLLHGELHPSSFEQRILTNICCTGVLLKAAWIPGTGCAIIQTDNKLLAATFIYGMTFDFCILLLTAFKLLYPKTGRSKLVNLIFNDGLIFFVIA